MAKTSIPSDAPISSHDPYTVLSRSHGTEGYDVSTPIQSVAATGEDINMWARYKPVVPLSDHPWPITEAEIKAVNFGLTFSYDGTVYESTSGVGVQPAKSFTEAEAVTEIAKCEWRYRERRPGETDWKRLTDWGGYNPSSVAPIATPGDFTLYSSSAAMTNITIRSGATGVRAENNLTLADFPYLSDLYLAVLIYWRRRSDNVVEEIGWVTASETIGNGGNVVSVAYNDLKTKTASYSTHYSPEYILCGATTGRDTLGTGGGIFYPLPSESPLTGTINITAASTVTMQGYGIGERNSTTGVEIETFRPVVDGVNQYFGAGNGLWLFCEISSSSGSAENIPLSNLRVQVRRSLGSGGMLLKPISVTPNALYTQDSKGGAYQQATTLRVPASGRVYAILDLSNITAITSSGTTTSMTEEYGTLMANIGRIGTSESDFSGSLTLNINIHPGTGVRTATTDNSALPAI